MFGIKDYDVPSIDIYDEEEYYTIVITEDGLDFAGKLALSILEYTKGKCSCIAGYNENIPKYKYTYQNNLVLLEGYTEEEITIKNNKIRKEINELDNYFHNYITLSEDEDSEIKLDTFFENNNADSSNINDIKEFLNDRNILTLEWAFIDDYLQILRLAKKNFILKEPEPLVFVTEYIEEPREKVGFFSSLFSIFAPTKKDNTKELSWEEEKFEREAKLWGLSEEDKRLAKQERMSPADFVEADERDDDELITDEWE